MEHAEYVENFDLSMVITPVDAVKLRDLLIESEYSSEEIQFLYEGFTKGFDIGYWGPIKGVARKAPNLRLRVGSETIVWNKIIKEVKKGRFAGPFRDKPPFDDFIQSPSRLVPKGDGSDTQLIFHLSYPRVGGFSINSETPRELCLVKYCDFSQAVRACLKLRVSCKLAKSDAVSAFHNLGILRSQWNLLVLVAKYPVDNKWYYFVDKCLPFGASISCAHFQRVSDAITHLVRWRLSLPKEIPINYLDDFLFTAINRYLSL